MKKQSWKSALAIVAVGATIVACNNPAKTTGGDSGDSTSMSDTSKTAAVTVTPVGHSKEFPGATLKIASLTSEKAGTDSAKITVKYTVENFKLTEQTAHEHADHMANSHEGQHIHFILDNKPYAALYKPENSVTVALNSEHYLLSFLSRSYHESIKSADAYKLVKFKVDNTGKITELPTPKEASLFYSRPKGEYKGEDTKNLLLDFYVVNTTLAADGNKVVASVNGQDFTLDQWTPYEIKGLPLGDAKIKLTLVDKDGKAVTGDNVSIERDIKLLEK
ncbi:hypothetical protein ACR79P_01980 [Sphingobacterium spiritivorum]|uniref:Uncharacterized protein n=1 Tax=Sphingobacterium spiritivorum ATCC 33861 TaxID=525373 RepID=D7VHB4_SPHSI|nr:hypothetical protein [Sphingobacterium spiritivorum]EFK59466.1 hypothetical protein HMPREF0766_10383 [Sphingobacterium spiritivorum ATCC 33861]QQT33855.1 hypothetical protein I6J01_10840 [Sphingobacterium spiritivorum]WQD34673.1 hypothetical protein U0038_02775 [Sphingobacterium spiritivorum]SUI97670.1 Uncharacterised protein [Sphingobacterium spiritivorum]